MIISASRRTDIPAFFHQWFMNRVKAGFLLIRNPYNTRQIRRVSLLPEEVQAIVFWTRNPANMMNQLPVLDQAGYKYYFQYTITGYPRELEKHTPHPLKAIENFCELSNYLGRGKVIWRYDPILLSNIVPLDEHKRVFSKIAESLAGKTERVVISFADLYKKTECNLKTINNLDYSDILKKSDELEDLLHFMKNVASKFEMSIISCAESMELNQYGVQKGKCIDDELLREQFNMYVDGKKDPGQREPCGCVKSIDIGQYNTCLHGCAYCYATFNHNLARKNWEKHDPNSPFLIGAAEDVDIALLAPLNRQEKLF